MDKQLDNWWNRPCGVREVLAIALPLVISTMSFSVMHFCDRMFLAWYDTGAMAAAAMAGALNWTVFSFPMGIAGYANTFVAQYHGAGRPEQIGAAVWQAARIALFAAPLFIVAAIFSPQLFQFFGHETQLLWNEVLYFRTLAFASCAIVLGAAFSSFFIGRGQTRIVMAVDMLAAAMNVVLDIIWIFGFFGFPEMGIEGAAWATVVSQWFKVVAYLWLMYRGENPKRFRLYAGQRFNLQILKRLLYYGGPNGLQFVIEGAAFTITLLLIGSLGETEAAASAVALSVNMVAFVPMVGVGIAISTLVGQQIGRGHPALAARATWTGLGIALAYTTIFGAMYLLIPNALISPHAVRSENFDEVRELAVVLLRFVAAFCLFDAVQLIFVNAIKGAGDTMFVLGTTVFTSTAFVLVGVFGSGSEQWGIMQWWLLITSWIFLLSVIYLGRFLQGNWRFKTVIEPNMVEAEKEVSVSEAVI